MKRQFAEMENRSNRMMNKLFNMRNLQENTMNKFNGSPRSKIKARRFTHNGEAFMISPKHDKGIRRASDLDTFYK